MYQPPQNPNEPTASSEQPYSQYPPQQPYYPGDNQPTYQTPPAYLPPPYPPPQPQRKSRTWLWIVLGVGIFLVLSCAGLIALAAIGSRSTTTITTPSTAATSNTPAAGNTPAATQAPAGVGKVGSTITVNDVATTLVSVKKLAADQYNQPKAGNQFIVVHARIKNNSTGEVDYNDFDFHVRSGNGNITDEEFVSLNSYTANNILTNGKLSPGGSVEGDLIFQVKKGDHAAELTWQPNILGNAGDN